MSCVHCGFNLESDQTTCPNCHQNSQVTVLPDEERECFNGLTIGQENGNEYYQSQNHSSDRHVYVRHINLNSRGNLLAKLLIGAFLLLFIIIALPVAIILSVCFAIFWFLRKNIFK
jgi:hypothetical protein